MTRLRRWQISLLLTAAAVLVCWAWVDRPVAHWLYTHRWFEPGRSAFGPLTHVPDPLIPIGSMVFLALGLAAMAGKHMTRFGAFIVLCCLSVITTETVKNGLKWVFGRPSPDSWRGAGLSLIRNGEYKFYWFAGVSGHNAFPSGHMAAAAAILGILWICYPKARSSCLAVGILIATALVVSNFHFVGDVIAGAFLGSSVAWLTVILVDQCPKIQARAQRVEWTEIEADGLASYRELSSGNATTANVRRASPGEATVFNGW